MSAGRRRLPGTGGPEGVNLPMDGISIPLTGRNSLMDWGLWLLLIGLIVLITFNDLWRLFTGAGWG